MATATASSASLTAIPRYRTFRAYPNKNPSSSTRQRQQRLVDALEELQRKVQVRGPHQFAGRRLARGDHQQLAPRGMQALVQLDQHLKAVAIEIGDVLQIEDDRCGVLDVEFAQETPQVVDIRDVQLAYHLDDGNAATLSYTKRRLICHVPPRRAASPAARAFLPWCSRESPFA